jgi:citrate lyase gamma subunit
MTTAKRKLSNFNFEAEGAHIALVHKEQGGPANGVDYALITKATKDISVKELEKATEVQVTMNIVDFLCKFFGLWYDDALVLAMAMGYDVGDAGYSFVEASTDYEDYLQERVEAINIMKSVVVDVEDVHKAVASLSPKDYLAILKVQEVFEKNFDGAVEKAEAIKKSSGIPAKGVTVSKETTTPSVEISNKLEDDNLSEFISKAVHEETVTKAVEEAIEKALAPVQEELKKAKEQLEVVEKANLEAVAKSRKEAVASVEKDEAKAEELFKSMESLADEAFDVVIKSLKAKEEVVENSDLFVQKSKDSDVEIEEENGTAAILKARHQKV